MRCGLASVLVALIALVASTVVGSAPDVLVVDDFEVIDAWSPHPADGVELAIGSDEGLVGKALRLDVSFPGAGYAVVRRELALDLPANYVFSFQVRGELPPNSLEFKLIDESGDNVWWSVRRDFEFDGGWKRVTIKKRHVSFAWGPAGGGEIEHVAAIEFAVTAGQGGTGSVWIDHLELRELPPPDATPPPPLARASSERPGFGAANVLDGDPLTSWRPAADDRAPWLELDLQAWREFGGVIVDWCAGECAFEDGGPTTPPRHPADYLVELLDDGERWRIERMVLGSNGGRDYLPLPEAEGRFIRVEVLDDRVRGNAGKASVVRGAIPAEIAIAEVSIQPLEWSATRENLFAAIARDAPHGSYPRGIAGEQSFWTVVGVDGDRRESLLGEDGALEVWPRGFSIEPFLYVDSLLVAWADVQSERWLARGSLPIPTVAWNYEDLRLEITAFAIGEPDAASTIVRYQTMNIGDEHASPTLYLTIRPFQVNPPSQWLNVLGGTARIRTIGVVLRSAGWTVYVDGEQAVRVLHAPAAVGASTFDGGDIVADYLRRGSLPATALAMDDFEAASAALSFPLELAPGDSAHVDLVVPRVLGASAPSMLDSAMSSAWIRESLECCMRDWQAHYDRFAIELPPSASHVVESLESQLAYILVNRDGPAIRPGTRAYDRSWIRDGALTSTALLRLGHAREVRDFIRWYAPYQFASGKVPCVVDDRGADPVPEHDSSGQFIYLVAEYYRFTRDRALVEEQWPRVVAAAAYLDSLRHERRTPEFETPEQRHFYGLLPPSISHEGYSAKPMHSYWDDFFALRGFRDAAFLARELGDAPRAIRFAVIADEFAADLGASIEAAMRVHDIDYIPGCADLGDFDPTSTTIALSPVGADAILPPGALQRTFDRYAEFFHARRRNQDWDAFTPYEIRAIGTFVRLGERDMAHELLGFFLDHQRPAAWRQWPEVVTREVRSPRFLGDLPHTWVGSDYVRALLDCFVYERASDQALVLAAGVSREWLESPGGVRVRGLRTAYGEARYGMRREDGLIEVRVDCELDPLPPGGVVLVPPLTRPPRSITIDGETIALPANGEIVIRRLPVTVRIEE
jgi:hypothetical protein